MNYKKLIGFVFFLFLGSISLLSVGFSSNLDYYRENSTSIYTKINLTANNEIFIQIKNTSTYIENPENIFLLFDDFNDGAVNSSKWDCLSGYCSESGGLFYTGDTTADYDYIYSQYTFSNGTTFEMINSKFDYTTAGTHSIGFDLGVQAPSFIDQYTYDPNIRIINNNIVDGTNIGTLPLTADYKIKWLNDGYADFYINNIFKLKSSNLKQTSAKILFRNYEKQFTFDEIRVYKEDYNNDINISCSNNICSIISSKNLNNIVIKLETTFNSGDLSLILGLIPQIQTNLTSYYNLENISIQLNTTSNTNMSYLLDNGSLNLICSDCNNTILNLTGLSEGAHSILFESKDSNGVVNSTVNFTIDLTNPIINNYILSEYNSYSFNLNSSCSDSNLDYCNITFNNQTLALNTSNFTSTLNGNLTYLIEAQDLAGNKINQTGTIFINPYFYIYFNDSIGNQIYNFSINGKNYSSVFSEKIYTIGLGSHSYVFDKIGYNATTFSFNLNTTSKLNISFSMPGAKIQINVYDQISNSLINTTNLTLDLIGPTNFLTYSTTGSFDISVILQPGDYQAFISGDSYLSNQISFNFDGKSIINKNFYLLPINSSLTGFVKITTYNADGSFAENLKITANQWDSSSSSYIETYQTKSDSNGEAIVPIILQNKLYRFCADYSSGQSCIPNDGTGQIISYAQNGQNFPLLPINNFPGIDFSSDNIELIILNNSLTNLSNSTYNYFIQYSWNSKNGLDVILCSLLEKDFNYSQTSIIDTCSNSSSSGSYINNFNLNNSYSYIFSIYSKDSNGNKFTLYSENIAGLNNFISFFEKYNVLFILKILIIAIMIGVIPFISSPFLIVADIVAAFFIVWKYIAPQEMSITTVGVIIVMGIATLWGLSKK